jgi:hypothetical protein
MENVASREKRPPLNIKELALRILTVGAIAVVLALAVWHESVWSGLRDWTVGGRETVQRLLCEATDGKWVEEPIPTKFCYGPDCAAKKVCIAAVAPVAPGGECQGIATDDERLEPWQSACFAASYGVSRDKGICDHADWPALARNRCYAAVAVSSADAALCGKITPKTETGDSCWLQLSVLSGSRDKEILSGFCENVSVLAADGCWTRAAIRAEAPELCAYVHAADARTTCQNYATR